MKGYDTRKTDRHLKLCKMYFEHMEQISGTLKFKCLLCGKVCAHQGSCFHHFNVVHKDLSSDQSKKNKDNQDQPESDTEQYVGYDKLNNCFIDVADLAKRPMVQIESLENIKENINAEDDSMLEIDNAQVDTQDPVENMEFEISDDAEEFEVKDEMENVSTVQNSPLASENLNEDNIVQASLLQIPIPQDHMTQFPMIQNQVPESLVIQPPLVPSTMGAAPNIQDPKAANKKEAIRNILIGASEPPSKDTIEDNEEDEIEIIEPTTKAVKSEFVPATPATRGPKPVTVLYGCPICSGKFLSHPMATEHVVQEHKIPIEKHSTHIIQFSIFEF